MPTFGNIGLSLPGSGSEITSSFNVLPVYFSSPSYSVEAATIGVLEAFVQGYDDTGSYGELSFKVTSNENRNTTGSTILKISSTGSNNEPRVGIGVTENQALESLLDLRSPTGSSPVNIVLRTNEDGVIEDGEETGRITFAIESSSYLGTGFIASGSTSAIYSRVLGSNINGAFGSLIFEVNDETDVTEPIEAMTIGYGLGPSPQEVGFILSGSVEIGANANQFRIVSTINGNELARIGFQAGEGAPFDRALFTLNDDGSNTVKLNSYNTADFINTGNNLGIGTTSPSEKLTVEGNISASGDITANNINAVTSLTASGINYPSADGTDGQVIITDGAGNLSFSGVSADDAEAIHIPVKNTSGVTITKGTPVYITGNVGNSERLEIAAADASDSAKMPAVGLLESDLDNNDQGFVAQGGYLRGLDTDPIDGVSTDSNDTIYVKAGGGLTLTKPTGSALIQNIAKVARSHGSAGSVIVSSILRTNDVPNITSGYAWVGNSDQVATAVATSSFVVDNANTASYVAVGNIDGIIDISDQTNLAGGTNLTLSGDTMNLDANISLTSITASGLTINGTGSVDLLQVDDKLQGNGSGFQFFAFNEDTTKVKFANWFTDTDNQYGMGMLWYETWFAAIDTDGNANDHNRRIGFYLEQPEAGATDSTSGETGRHPNNARFYVDITGSYVASGSLTVTDADFKVSSSGDVDINGDLDMNNNDINNVNNFTINNTLTATTVTGSLLRLSENGTGLRMTNVGAFENSSGDFNIFATNTNLKFSTDGSSNTRLTLNSTKADFTVPLDVTGDITASGKIADSTYPTDNLLNLHDDNVVNANGVTLSSIGSTVFMIDSNNSGTSDKFEFRADSTDAGAGTLLATIEDNGDLDVEGAITSQGYAVVSQSSAFTDNEFIVADGTGGVASTDALAVDSSGNLGIGISTPEVRLHMRGESAQTAQFLMEQYNDTADAPDIRTRRFRGTPAAPADVQTGDYLFRINVEGRDGGANVTYGSMQFDVDGTDQNALNWRIQTRDTGGTLADRITIDSAGDLDVAGDLAINGIANVSASIAEAASSGGGSTSQVFNGFLRDEATQINDSNFRFFIEPDGTLTSVTTNYPSMGHVGFIATSAATNVAFTAQFWCGNTVGSSEDDFLRVVVYKATPTNNATSMTWSAVNTAAARWVDSTGDDDRIILVVDSLGSTSISAGDRIALVLEYIEDNGGATFDDFYGTYQIVLT